MVKVTYNHVEIFDFVHFLREKDHEFFGWIPRQALGGVGKGEI